MVTIRDDLRRVVCDIDNSMPPIVRVPNEDEVNVLNLSADLWNEYIKLPKLHEDDLPDFKLHLHALQRIILARCIKI